jgi:hypothetical protein
MRPVLFTVFLLAGCRHTPLSYSLVPQGREPILLPPGGPKAQVLVKNARASKQTGCDIRGDLIQLHWTGKSARIGLVSEPPDREPAGIPNQSGARVVEQTYTDSLKSLETFRSALRDRQTAGCLPAASTLLRTITERLPFAPRTAYYLRFGAFGQSGFYDLTPDFRLKVVSPVPAGVEIAYYKIAAMPKDDRVHLSLDSVSATAPGKSTLTLPDSVGHFRMLFWTSLSSTDHFATMIESSDRAALEEATRRFQVQPSCQDLGGVSCITIPPDFAVNAELRIQVNESEQYVPLGGTVRDAVGNHKTFQVERLFDGRPIPVKFDPTRGDITQFVLMPGDRISW